MVRIDVKMTGMERTLNSLGYWDRTAEKAVERAVHKSGQYLRKQWMMGIRSQAPGGKKFKPLKQSTIDAKGSSKALIDKADMIRSINVQKVRSGRQIVFFVGIHRTVVTKDGKSMANLAEVHETGSLKVKNRPPARPHMKPSWDVYIMTAEKQFAFDVAKDLGLEGSLRARVMGVTGGIG